MTARRRRTHDEALLGDLAPAVPLLDVGVFVDVREAAHAPPRHRRGARRKAEDGGQHEVQQSTDGARRGPAFPVLSGLVKIS